jgi:hypothetical protein
MDRGMVSDKNLGLLRQNGRRYIIGTPKACLKQVEQHLLGTDWQVVREGVSVKICPTPDIKEEVIKRWGRDVLDERGDIQRRRLSHKVFANTKELRALDWSKINLPERTIRIDASLAKTRQRRVIEIGDALVAYLTPYAKRRGLVVDLGAQEFRRRWEACRRDAGILPWPHDVMRHTFATYHLAAFNDIGKLSLQMGNSPQVIQSAYKGLVSKADATRFFSLRPAAGAARRSCDETSRNQ